MSSVNGIHGNQPTQNGALGRLIQTQSGETYFVPVSLEQPNDQVSLQNNADKPKKSFSYLRATGRFLQGAVADTVGSIFSTGGLLGIGVSAGLTAMFGAPALIGLGALGAVLGTAHIINGIRKSNELYSEGKVKESEDAFRGVGVGVSSLALSVAGLKTSIKAYWTGGKAQVTQLGDKAKTASTHLFKRMGSVAKSFVAPDGKTLQLPTIDGNKILQRTLINVGKGAGTLAQNGTVANGLAYNNLRQEGEFIHLKDKLDSIHI